MVRDPTSPRLVRKAHLFASAQEALEKACKASSTRPHQRDRGREGNNDSEADVPSTKAFGAICVQNFNDSRGSAIHTTYRISLRSSSLREPRYPSAGVVCWLLTEDTRHPDARTPTGDERRRASGLKGIPDASAAQERARETTEDGKKEVRPRRKRRRRPAPPPEGREKERRRLPRGIAAL